MLAALTAVGCVAVAGLLFRGRSAWPVGLLLVGLAVRNAMEPSAATTVLEVLLAVGVAGTVLLLLRRSDHRQDALLGPATGEIERERVLTDLLRVSAATSSAALDLPSAARPILQQVCTQMDWSLGHLWLTDGQSLRSSGLWHLQDPGMGAALRPASEQAPADAVDLAAAVARSGQAQSHASGVEYLAPGRREAARALGLHAWVGLPIRGAGETLGVLEFMSLRPQQLSPRALEVLAEIGTQLGRVEVKRRQDEERERLHALRRQGDLARESEELTRLTVEHALDAVVTMDEHGRIVAWNEQARRTFGWTREEVSGRPLVDVLIPQRDREAHRAGVQRYLATGATSILDRRVEVAALRKDGSEVQVELAVAALRHGDRTLFSAFLRDISARAETERKLAQHASEVASLERRFRAAVESAPTAMIMVNADGQVLLVNAETERLFGYDREELIGQSIEVLVPQRFRRHHPGQRVGFFDRPEARRMGAGRELFALRKDGREFPVEIGLNPVETEDGLYVVSAVTDITERRQTEEKVRQYAAELERSNRELDQFAYSASHDLKAPLHAVRNLAEWIAEDAGELLPERSRSDLALLQNRVGRLERLLDDLLAYARVGRVQHQPEALDVGELVEDVVALLEPPAGFEVRVGALPHLIAPRAPLSQVFRNLIGNAVKHHDREAGVVEVAARETKDAWEFSVCDDGPGIPAEYHEQVFSMFQTLKPRDDVEGSGVGLALVRKILQTQGGSITLESRAGDRGTTFRFTWPR